MKLKTFFNTLVISTMCIASISSQFAFAEEYPVEDTIVIEDIATNSEAETRAAGLITAFYINIINSSNSSLTFVATTMGSNIMQSIGLKNVYIQRSLDCVSWDTEINLGNLLNSNATSYSESIKVNVEGGYYYRIYATHHARKSALSSQSVTNTSGSAYVYQ